MRVLVVKLTSMGDVLHLLPALSDLQTRYPDVVVDWMVEESFADLPKWHPSVDRVIAVASRRWRKQGLKAISEFLRFRRNLRDQPYDLIIDAQGLVKSAVFARFAKLAKGGRRSGFCGDSIKESPAAWLYSQKVSVPRNMHAVDRLRMLIAGVFDYDVTSLNFDSPEYVPNADTESSSMNSKRLMFFHGTTWPSKHLPESMWQQLIELARDDGFVVDLAWGNQDEYERATRLADGFENASVLEKLSLNQLRVRIAQANGAIAVDTGLGHMAAALGVPCISVFGSTSSQLTGAKGHRQVLKQSDYPCSPCLLKNCDKLKQPDAQPPCYVDTRNNGDLSANSLWRSLMQELQHVN